MMNASSCAMFEVEQVEWDGDGDDDGKDDVFNHSDDEEEVESNGKTGDDSKNYDNDENECTNSNKMNLSQESALSSSSVSLVS
eukprot:1378082-Ditylum_brightwellii.AAC.1